MMDDRRQKEKQRREIGRKKAQNTQKKERCLTTDNGRLTTETMGEIW